LSYFTGVKWYNASVREELNDITRYKNFVKDFSARIDRMKVRYVVYSTLSPYQTQRIGFFRSDKSRIKIKGLAVKPKKSFLAYINHRNIEDIPQRNGYGDLIFDDRVKCDFSESHATREREAEREDIDIAVDFLVDMANFFSSVFPNASIQIV